MIVDRIGYLKMENVLKLLENKEDFGLYLTHKKTVVLVKGSNTTLNLVLYYPQYDRLPYKIVEGKSIVHGKRIFDSKTDDVSNLTTTGWNNGNQVMAYSTYYGR